jgi:hypothetical protein
VLYIYVNYRLLTAIIKTNLLNCVNVLSTQFPSPTNRVILLTIAVFKVRLCPEERTASLVALHQCRH